MGVCLSCLGVSRKEETEVSARLIDTEDPFSQYANYGATGQSPSPQQEQVNPEDARREREALDNITNWTTNSVVDVWTRRPQASMIPGDKDHIARVYPASRPASQASDSSFRQSSHLKHVNGTRTIKADEVPLVRTLKIDF